MLKMTIDNEEVLSDNDISIKEEILSPSSTILNNVYPKSWELDKDYTSRFYYPKDYSKLNIQNFSIEPEEAGKTIQVNGSATLTDVDTSKESRVLRILGQTSQTGTPTPSSPIPINVVSGDNTIDICGKNSFNPTETWTYFGVTCSINNQQITWSGTSATGTARKMADINLPSGAYIISLQTISGNHTSNKHIWIDYMQGNTKIAGDNFTQDGSKQRTLSDKVDNIKIGFDSADTFNNYTFVIQIEKGSTATTYEPYIGNTYPIYLGVENLFDSSSIIDSQKNKRLSTSGTYYNENGYFVSGWIPIHANEEYVANWEVSAYQRICFYSSNTEASFISKNDTDSTFTTPSNAQYLRFSALLTNLDTAKIGNQNFIELCKIGDYQDYIYKDNGSWYLHKEIGKFVLDGSEAQWAKSGASTQTSLVASFNLQTSGTNTKFATSADWRVNRFAYGSLGVDGKFQAYNGNAESGYNFLAFTVPTSIAGDLSTFKTWVASNNIIVYYVLATPTDTEITDTNLIEQLESLSS